MTIHNQTPEETAATDAPVSEQRRTLIKASATAPLAATLFSGSALATSSLACQGGDFSNKKFLENGNSINGDTAVRVEVDYYQRESWPTGPRNSFPRDLYDIGGVLYHNSGQSYPIPESTLTNHYSSTKAYVLVLYSFENGCAQELGPWPKVQLATEGGYGTPITTSCLTSIAVSDSCNMI